MKMDVLTNALNQIMNAKRVGKNSCVVPASKLLINVLKVMHKHGYISYKIEKKEKNASKKVAIEIQKLNECRAITPRFYVKVEELEKYVRRFLPSRELGILIISTSSGLLTNKEATQKKLGGSLIAYCF